MKNRKAISPLIIILIIVGVLIGGYVLYTLNKSNAIIDNGFMKVRLYDINGNPITGNTLSTVGLGSTGGVRGVGSIDITVKVSNSPTSVPIACDILPTGATVNGASGTAFDSALTRRTLTIPVGSSAEWTSNQFLVNSFEGGTRPDVFAVTVRCKYIDSTGEHIISPDQSGSINLYIDSDGTGSFTVNVNPPGGLPQLYCGDGTCNNAETISTCPVDCVTLTNSQYRAFDLSYPQGSAIAYGTCGSLLTQFGYESSSCWAVTGDICPTLTGYTPALSSKTIPGRPFWAKTTTPSCLYTKNGDLTRMVVAFQVLTLGGSPCTTGIGQWGTVNYCSLTGCPTNLYASEVSNSIATLNNMKEIIC